MTRQSFVKTLRISIALVLGIERMWLTLTAVFSTWYLLRSELLNVSWLISVLGDECSLDFRAPQQNLWVIAGRRSCATTRPQGPPTGVPSGPGLAKPKVLA